MIENNDNDLVKACLEGDLSAFEALVERYQKTIFNTALNMVRDRDEAKDITQDVFIRAYENLRTFKPEYKFFSWIYKMAINLSINVINRRKHEAPLDTKMVSNDKGPEWQFEVKQLEQKVQDSIAELSIEQRVVIILRHFAELSYRELGFVLDIPEKRVKSRLFDARQQLSKILSRNGIAEYGL